MKPHKDCRIGSLLKDREYEYVAQHSFDVYPGWASRHVYRHLESGTLWAKDYFMSDDDGHEGQDWFEVKPVVTTRYEAKK